VRKRVRQISKEEVLNCLLENPQYVELLRRAVQIEEAHRGDKRWLGWSWDELPAHPATINKLIIKGLVYKSYDSAKFTHYKLVNLEATKWALRELETLQNQPATPVEEREAEIPPDMFDVVEGYDDLKEFILASLNADEPVHILLVGSPGTAKSLLLSEIERLEGARYIPMGTATKVGIRDILFEEMPRYLIVDDLDKLSDKRDIAALLEWMQFNRITIIKHGLRETRRGKGWVFASSNRLSGIYPELIDRFQVFHIKPYSPEEFHKVVTNYLCKRKGVPLELAEYIATKVGEYTVSVREAVRISRLAKTREEVDRKIEIVKKYRIPS